MKPSDAFSKGREASEIIADALQSFTDATGLQVHGVDIKPVFDLAKREPVLYHVSLDARL